MHSALLAITAAAFVSTADAHSHLARVNTASGESASNRAGIRNGIVRNAGSGIPPPVSPLSFSFFPPHMYTLHGFVYVHIQSSNIFTCVSYLFALTSDLHSLTVL